MIGLKKNIAFPQSSWYVANLEPQRPDLRSKSPLLVLPVGNKKYVFDTVHQPSKESFYTKQYSKETQTINAYQFRYLKETHGDVFTLINMIHWLHYIKDHESEGILAPYLNVKKWNEYVKEKS